MARGDGQLDYIMMALGNLRDLIQQEATQHVVDTLARLRAVKAIMEDTESEAASKIMRAVPPGQMLPGGSFTAKVILAERTLVDLDQMRKDFPQLVQRYERSTAYPQVRLSPNPN